MMPNLFPAEIERLALLSEEMGEAIQAIGKILRHGYKSYNPFIPNGRNNREDLEKELGDVQAAIELMTKNGDVRSQAISDFSATKQLTVIRYLHHQVRT